MKRAVLLLRSANGPVQPGALQDGRTSASLRGAFSPKLNPKSSLACIRWLAQLAHGSREALPAAHTICISLSPTRDSPLSLQGGGGSLNIFAFSVAEHTQVLLELFDIGFQADCILV